MAKRMTKAQKQVERAVELAHSKHGMNVQINVMDIGKIFRAGETAYATATAAGSDHDTALATVEGAVVAAIAQYRQN